MSIAKKMIREIGQDLSDAVYVAGDRLTDLGIGVYDISCKLSYLLLGNLSPNLQHRLEGMLGYENKNEKKKHYDQLEATICSTITNPIIYPLVTDIIITSICNPSSRARVLAATGTAIFGVFEGALRYTMSKNTPVASIPGKIASLPFELACCPYDYVKGVYRRAKLEEQKEEHNKTKGSK